MTLDGTNTWVLRAPGRRPAVVVDPGPLDEGHLAAVAAHGPVAAILVTHGHPDHVEGAAAARRADRRRRCDPRLVDARAFDGVGRRLRSRCWPRPGTPPTRSASWSRPATSGSIFTGDTILGRGTTVVAWPDGDLGDYLASLELLAALRADAGRCRGTARRWPTAPRPPGSIWPTGGPGSTRSGRRSRPARDTPADVVDVVYADVDPALWSAAEWSVRAQLDYLRRESQPALGTVGPAVTCPVCGTVAVPGARFCHNCGAALPPRPPCRPPSGAIVTVLFGDLSDFTSWSEDLDPERVGAVTDRVLAALAGAVKTFGGHVDKLTGDGIMAVFGAPVAHEDDAERAVRAALSMQRAVRRVLDDERGGGAPLGLRVGLNTGEVVAGIQAAIEYTVIGDTVNTAARLADAAAVGAVYAGATHRRRPPGTSPPGGSCGRCGSRASASRSRRTSCSACTTRRAPGRVWATRRRSSAARPSWAGSPAGSPR